MFIVRLRILNRFEDPLDLPQVVGGSEELWSHNQVRDDQGLGYAKQEIDNVD
jgi:hypothetical protein